MKCRHLNRKDSLMFAFCAYKLIWLQPYSHSYVRFKIHIVLDLQKPRPVIQIGDRRNQICIVRKEAQGSEKMEWSKAELGLNHYTKPFLCLSSCSVFVTYKHCKWKCYRSQSIQPGKQIGLQLQQIPGILFFAIDLL